MINRLFDNCLKVFRSSLKMTEAFTGGIKRLREEKTIETCSVEDDQVEKKLRTIGVDDNKDVSNQRIKYSKYAMLVSFCGQGYFGMQINGDTPTIESEILMALRKCDLIDDEDRLKPGEKLNFQRAARTDKNVSAVKQMCSLKLNRNLHDELNTKFVEKLNEHLPEKIRIWEDQLVKIQNLLDKFKGTSNYFNFTSGRSQDDKSCNRYIIACKHEEPFEIDGIEFITITIRGQSFMMHQIRKIIGLTIAVIRGFAEDSIIPRALSNQAKVCCRKSVVSTEWHHESLMRLLDDRNCRLKFLTILFYLNIDVPKAPGLGLVLEEVHYDWYNGRYEKTHEKICWDKFEDDVRGFRRNFIDRTIVETEKNTESMIEWLKVLDLHEFSYSDKERETMIKVHGEMPPTESLNVRLN